MADGFNELKVHRLDPPGNWRWPCRFSLEELKALYCKLFGYGRVSLHPNRPSKTVLTYDVLNGRSCSYGAVRLEDGGQKRLESCTAEELDWLLLVGKHFVEDGASGSYALDKNHMENPLFGVLDRYSALVKLDLLQRLPRELGTEERAQ